MKRYIRIIHINNFILNIILIGISILLSPSCTHKKAKTSAPLKLAQTMNIDKAPISFGNKISAIKAGCNILQLKGNGKKTAILSWVKKKSLFISLYEPNDSGSFHLKETIEIPDKHWNAEISYHSNIIDQPSFLGIVFRFSGGTSYRHRMFMLIGWNKVKYEIALLENHYIKDGLNGYDQQLFLNKRLLWLGLNLKWSYLRQYRYFKTHDQELTPLTAYERFSSNRSFLISGSWHEVLTWDDNNFTFYDKKAENEIIKSPMPINPLRVWQAKARVHFLNNKPDLKNLKKYFKINYLRYTIPHKVLNTED